MRTYKAILAVLTLLFIQGCSTFRTCASMMDNEAYSESQNHKAIAMYFDRGTERPPNSIKNLPNECWYDSEGESQEEVNKLVMNTCEESLRNGNRFEDWQCVLIAQGDQLTEAEQERIGRWGGYDGKFDNKRSRMLYGDGIKKSYTPPADK
ncbi:MAG: hypothetical protein ACI9FD_004564 [Gammaproteobacteria bacterium]|jgi:hypothetical protein